MDSQSSANTMQNLVNQITENVKEATSQLEEEWKLIGFDSDTCEQRSARVLEHVKNLMQDMIEGEQNLRKKLIQSIDDNGPEFYNLNKELGTAIPDPDDNLTLLELERYLRHRVQELHKIVKERRAKLRELKDHEQNLCECLVEEPCNMKQKVVPSQDDIEDLERRIRTLEQEKVNRQKTFSRLKSTLLQLLEELEQSATSSLERMVVSAVEDLFVLSTENLHQLKLLNEKYEQRVKDNKKESLELQEKIRLLNDRLGVDPSERDHFQASVSGHTPTVLTKLREELKRLEELKKQNLARFINQMKRELEGAWEKCYTSEEEREAFAPYSSEFYTEEVLEAHERELQRLHTHLAENKHFFSRLDHWHQLWNKHLEMEDRAQNPNRLFGNRGGTLLQEERERRRVNAELPRVEEELKALAQAWEGEHGRPFLIGGKPVPTYLLNIWHDLHRHKEQEKKERVARTKASESFLGKKPVKRRIAHNDTSRSKSRRIVENPSPNPSITSSPRDRGSRLVLRDRNVTMKVQTPKKHTVSSSSNDLSSYCTFSDTLHRRSQRENVRSSSIYGGSKTPKPSCRSSPHRTPRGLPRTPKTVPRRSPRLSNSQHPRQRLGKSHLAGASPSLSAAFKSPCRMSRLGTPTTPRWSKVSFLI